ncbi:MAG: hypothetical protein J3Q66DRAFT_347537 [Benniella sp.]|nr:MAG: hypothetical protein J3Q66DRAFT_347537 [Benniella sp.]
MQLKRSFTTIALGVLSLMALVSVSEAHCSMRTPCPRGSPVRDVCPNASNGQEPDYNINTPIGKHGSKDFPLCKNTYVQNQRTVVRAGKSLQTTYSVGASHGGGHCQWALSYDGGKTWAVVHTVIRECLKNISNGQPYSVSVPIPKNAPNGKATFMWLWNNAIGNRELYSNCADIEIKGGSNARQFKGVAPLIANYGSDSPLIGEFPQPGDDDKRELFAKRKPVTLRVR